MKHKVKWVEDNLGITRNMIRRYEKEGLLPKNVEGRDREFTEEELVRLWCIRVFVKMGFGLNDIRSILCTDVSQLELKKLIETTMEQLIKERNGIQKKIDFMKILYHTGQIPSGLEFACCSFDEVYKMALKQYKNPLEPELKMFWVNMEGFVLLHKLSLLKDEMLDSDKVQIVIQKLYEWFIENKSKDCTRKMFAEIFVGYFSNQTVFNDNECSFMIDSIAYFGEIEILEV